MFTFTSPIVTNRLVLRPYTAEDVEDLYAILLNPNVVRYLYWEVCDRDQVRDAIERKSKQTQLAEQDDALTLAMVSAEAEDTKTGVIGEIKLWLRIGL
jgi:RimJ/RimL family protein N-acetyltransferase